MPADRERAPVLTPPFPILCFAYHPWSPMWKRNQSLMAALARRPAVERVVFVNPEVTLTTPVTHFAQDMRSLKRYSWRGVWPHRPAPGVEVVTPTHVIPMRGRSATLARIDRALVRGVLDRFGNRPFLLLVNGVRAETQETIALVEGKAAYQIFDWSDDFAQFPRDPEARHAIEALTAERVRRADLVLAVNENLAARARALGSRVEVISNATGLEPRREGGEGHSAPVRGARALERRLTRPVIGYCGFINEHRVDLELVVAMAQRHPEWTILFLGVVQLEFDRRFPPLENIIFHSPVPHAVLSDYLALFDVCMIPHLRNAHTAGNDPLKIYDYLTTGRPIVSTPIAGVEGFEDVIAIGRDHEEFIVAVEAAVAARMSGKDAQGDENERARARARRARAAEHTWEARARRVEALLLAEIGAASSGPQTGE